MVSAESVVTQLVFDHSLRIRMTGETDEDKEHTSSSDQSSGNPAGSVASESGLGVNADGTLSQPTIDTQTKGQATIAEGHIADDADAEPEPEAATEALIEEIEKDTHLSTEKPKTGHLIGKINNLVTTDLSDVMNLQDAFALRESLLNATRMAVVTHRVFNSVLSHPNRSCRDLSI